MVALSRCCQWSLPSKFLYIHLQETGFNFAQDALQMGLSLPLLLLQTRWEAARKLSQSPPQFLFGCLRSCGWVRAPCLRGEVVLLLPH